MNVQGKTISYEVNSDGTISLYNRDMIETYLKPITDDVYLLKSEIDFGIRIIYDGDNPNAIMAIDPAGGPFIMNGDVIDNRIVKKIVHNKELNGFMICLQTRK